VNAWEAQYQIVAGKKHLEDLLGKEVGGFCYPSGKYRQRDVKLVKDCGCTYARTVMNLCFDAGANPFEIPTTIQFYPHERAVYVRNFARAGNWPGRQEGLRLVLAYRDWIERMYALFEHACKRGGVFHLWAHSRDLDKFEAWQELDAFFAHVAARVELTNCVTNAQLAALCQSHAHRLPLAEAWSKSN
jgi:hypothetical protein